MMTIEEEIKHLISFLQSPVGFSVDMSGQLRINPIYEVREFWEVSWTEPEDNIACEFHKEFVTLEEAAVFFVEKRHYLCLGQDFNDLYEEDSKSE